MTGKNTGFSEIYGKWNAAVERTFKTKSPKARMIIFASHAVSLLTAMLFSIKSLPLTSLSLGVPLADAFLCSVTRFVPSAYVGAMLGARISGNGNIVRYLLLTAIFLLRTAVSAFLYEKRYREPIYLRLCYSAVLCFAQCVIHLASSGIHSELALKFLGTLIATPILCLVISYYFASELKNSVKGSTVLKILHLASAFFVFSCVVYCARDLRFAGGSLACMLAIFLTLTSAKRGGILVGGLAGAMLGYLYSPVYALATTVIGVSSGVFFFLGALPAVGISAAVGCFTAFKTVGYTALLSFIPECVLALAIASPVIRYSFLSEDFPFLLGTKAPVANGTPTFHAEISERYGRLMQLSGAFRELSGSLVSYTRPNERADQLCNAVCHKFCDSCPVSPICWESERKRTSECIKTMISAFTGDVNAEKAPKYLSEHCIKFKELTSEIEYNCKKSRPELKPKERAGVFEFAAFSAILSDIAEEELSALCDDGFSQSVFKAAAICGIQSENVTTVSGKNKKIYLHGIDIQTAERMAVTLEKTFGVKFKTTEPQIPQDASFVLVQSEIFKANAAFAKLTKPGEVYSGDATFAFSDANGRYFAVLTDGMGSGEEAAECSAIASSLLEKLLRCNVRKSLAAEMLGDVLRKRESECFCTVDILETDLVSGSASFLKCGAAASYVLRRGSVHSVSACSMPVGITERVTPEEMSFTLSAGDIVIMVSDGVAAEPSDGSIFTDILTAGAFGSINELADRILSRAVKRNGRTDDMTVMVVEITKTDDEREQKSS